MANRKYIRRLGRRSAREGSSVSQLDTENSNLPAILFDLDGTLIDSVYEHVLAWSLALRSEDFFLPTWKIHRHIGMSAKMFVRELLRELSSKECEALT